MICGQCGTEVPDNASFCHSCGSQVSDAGGPARASGAMTADALKHTENLLKQETKGEFEIEGLLGRGGMAMVYLATEIHLSRKVAIKVLPPELTFGHGVERFKREAKTAAALDHPNIIPIYRIGQGGKLFWYAMKFLEGQSLDHLLSERERLSLEETIAILMPVAEALDYGHLHSVIHRDIKPANIMLDTQNRVIVTDFGIAKALTQSTLTASGSVIGTPFYMSPEQGMGKPVSGASDQYSVAVMTFRMLSGQVPFEGDSAIEILHKHCSVEPPPLEELKPGLPDYVYKAIAKGLAKKPAQRFSTVKAFVKALKEPSPEITVSDQATEMVLLDPSVEDRIGTEGMERATAPPSVQPPSTARPVDRTAAAIEKKSSAWKVLVPLLVIVAVGIGGAGWWFGQRGPAQPASPAERATATQNDRETDTTSPADSPNAAELANATNATDAATRESESTRPTPSVPAATPTTGTIAVTDMMPSGLVLVDGQVQSAQTFEVAPGRHTIEMRQPGYQTQTETVSVRAGQTLSISYASAPVAEVEQTVERPGPQQRPAPQYGILSILLRPSSGANVFIDGELVAETTTRLEERLEAGRHSVRIERSGYLTIDTTVTVTANGTTDLRLRLRRP